jgi:hypothetical protein
VDANINNYGIVMSEQGTSSGFYLGSFPTGVTQPGNYAVVVYKQAGGSLVVSDTILGEGNIHWDGEAEVTDEDITLVKLFSGVTGTDDDDLLMFLLSAAKRAVDKYLHSIVEADDFIEVRNGEGSDYLKTWNRPINSLTSITFDLNDTNSQTVAGSEFVYDADTGIIKFKPTSTARRYFCGFQSIEVQYNAGYEPEDIPDDIKLAWCKIVDTLYKQSNESGLIGKKKVGDVLVEYYDILSPVQISLNDPIFGDVRTLLAPYRNRRL